MREKKSPFIIYPYFESILVRKHYGKKNLKEINTKKHQKHIAFSHDYKLVSVDDKFSNLFKTYFSKDAVYNFINNTIEENKYCNEVMKKHFNKEPVLTRADNEYSKKSEVRDHWHITEKHRDCNINLTLNHKTPAVFHNLKNFDSHLIRKN